MAFEYEVKILQFFGSFPKNYTKWAYIKMLLMYSVLVVNSCGPISYIFLEGDFRGSKVDLIGCIAMILSQILAIICHILHFRNGHIIKRAFQEIDQFGDGEKPHNFEYLKRRFKQFSQVCTLIAGLEFLGQFGYCVFKNCSENDPNDCGLMMPVVLPSKFKKTPIRQCICTMQLLVLVCFAFYGTITFVIIVFFIDLLSNRFIHLKYMVSKTPLQKSKDQLNYFSKCVKYHQKIIELSERFKVNADSLFYTFSIICINIAILTCSQLKAFNINNFNHCIVAMGIMIFCCSSGQHIENHSTSLATTVFHSIPWNGNIKLQKDMLMMIIRSQKPMTLPVGKIGTATFPTFLAILKLQYSLITFFYGTI